MMANENKSHIVEELETQFLALHKKIIKAKDNYIANHQKDYDKAKSSAQRLGVKFDKARTQASKATTHASKSGSAAAQNQLKKAKAAAIVMGEAAKEAREIMSTAEDKLKAAKPFEKKLAARARALAAFEKDWQKKQDDAEKAKQKRAAQRKKTVKAKAKS
jgi:colicin import membrane protein